MNHSITGYTTQGEFKENFENSPVGKSVILVNSPNPWFKNIKPIAKLSKSNKSNKSRNKKSYCKEKNKKSYRINKINAQNTRNKYIKNNFKPVSKYKRPVYEHYKENSYSSFFWLLTIILLILIILTLVWG